MITDYTFFSSSHTQAKTFIKLEHILGHNIYSSYTRIKLKINRNLCGKVPNI